VADVVDVETAIEDVELGFFVGEEGFQITCEINNKFTKRAKRVTILFITPIGHVRSVVFEETMKCHLLIETELFVAANQISLVLFSVVGVEFDVEDEVGGLVAEGILFFVFGSDEFIVVFIKILLFSFE